jgi:twinkle protein
MDFAKYNINIPYGSTGEVQTTCPQCSSQRKKKHVKCLSVNTDKNCWICHHCGWSGPVKQDIPLHWQKPTYRKAPEIVSTGLSPKVEEWFIQRGIGASTLSHARIKACSTYMPQIEGHANAICFPYYRNGELINVKYRTSDKHFKLEAGCERIPYGLDDITDQIIWVEGEMDKLSFLEAGIESCLSVPDGAPSVESKNYESKFTFLDGCDFTGKTHIIAVDSDAAGKRLESELARRLGHENCKLVKWPDDCKDANEVLIKYGADELILRINQAEAYPIDGIFSTADQAETVRFLCDSGPKQGVTTGHKDLDSIFRPRLGGYCVVTGVPNTGKSPFVDHIAARTNEIHGWKWGIYSAEHEPVADHMRLFVQRIAKKSTNPQSIHKIHTDQIDAVLDYMKDNFFWISPGEDDVSTLDRLLELALVLVRQKGINALILDPWNEIECDRPKEMTEHEHIGFSLRKIGKFCRKNNIFCMIVAHPKKIQKDSEGRYEVVKPYDIAGSSNWFNKPPQILSLWRDAGALNSQALTIYCMKAKFKEIGCIGKTELAFNKEFETFHDLDKARDEIPPSYGVSA